MSSTQPYDRQKGYQRVEFRLKTPVIHTELNEIQLREADFRKEILERSLGENSSVGNNGFRVMPTDMPNDNSVIIWPGELFVDGKVMILDSPLQFTSLLGADPSIRLWAKFVPVTITEQEDSDIVYPSMPISAHRFTYEIQIIEKVTPMTNAEVNDGEFVFLLAEIDTTDTDIEETDITDLRDYWSNNAIVSGVDIDILKDSGNTKIAFSDGEIVIGNVPTLVSGLGTVLVSDLGPNTRTVFYIDGAGDLQDAAEYPVGEAIVKLLDVTTDAGVSLSTPDAIIKDDRVYSTLPILRRLDNTLTSEVIGGTSTFGVDNSGPSTTNYTDIDLSDPILYPEFALGDPNYAVTVTPEGDASSNLVGNIWVDYDAVAQGFRVYNTGSDNFSSFRWTVQLIR
jgi:hypothetical protein